MRKISITLTVLLIGLAFWSCQKSDYRPVKQYAIEQFMNTTRIFGSSFSPDEKTLLFSSNKTGIFNAYTVPVAGGEPTPLTDSKDNSVFAISFFPNDNRILYSSDKGGNEINHIYVRDEDGTARDLTPGDTAKAQFYGWSHDDKSFFYGFNQRDKRFFDVYEMDIATFTPAMIYQNDKGLNFGDISNDKRYIAFSKSTTTNNSDMYLYDRETQEMKHLTPHEGDVQYSPETFSVDSKSLYFLTDEGDEFQYLKRYDIASGQSEKVEATNWDIWYAYFSRNGKYRVVGINNDAKTEIKIYDTATNQPIELPKLPNAEITSVNISRSENLMTFYLNGSRSPNNLYAYDFATKKYTQLTNTMNPEIDQSDLVEAQVVRYKSFDGVEIPSVYYKPQHIKPGEKAPALVWVHGGPGGQSRVSYSPLIQYLVNHGYAVIAVNNRGSSGYGKTFFKMDDLKHGEEDLSDCVEAKKFLAATGYVDEKKIGIIGGSYGGYMVLAGLAFRPEEFAVGVDIFGVANWVRTLKSIPPWWESFREALYKEMGNPATDEDYLRRISPLFHPDKITKPLIVLQGANDPRVLKVESDEIVEAVKKNGVPVEYVVFDDEGHGFMKKENEIEGYKAILYFLDKHLKGMEGEVTGTN
ncbi:S9 family peptidase [candidate division KSB1 bacterium]|nr:S9 family peptidase [candidate division KSB1 bacterium]